MWTSHHQKDWDFLYNPFISDLSVDTGVWTNVTTATNGPSARFSVAGDCLDPFRSGVLIFIGGCNKSLEALDDMYYLYTGSAKCHLFATLLTFLMQPFLVLIFC